MRNKAGVSDSDGSDDDDDDDTNECSGDKADDHHHCCFQERQLQPTSHDVDGSRMVAGSDADADADNVVYLNNAHQASRLDPSVQRVGVTGIAKQAWQQQQQQTNDDDDDDDPQHEVRRLFAQLIGVDNAADCIVIMPSTAFAVTLAAHNIFAAATTGGGGGRGDDQRNQNRNDPNGGDGGGRIVVLQDQFDSAIYPWQEVCRASRGAISLDVVPYPSSSSNESWTHAVMERLYHPQTNNNNNNNNIRAVCLPPLHWADGALLDLHVIGTFCQEHDIPFIVDATQAVGIFPIHVTANIPGCSMLACSVHKWLRAPPGTCLVYIHKDLHDAWHPLDQHAFSRDLPWTQEASRNSMGPNGYPWETYHTDARKFDSGGCKTNSLLLPMLRASLELVVQLDLYQVQEQLGAHSGRFTIPARHANHSSGLDYANHLVGLRPTREMSANELLSMTKQLQHDKGIYIAARCGGLRISPYLDNSLQDIQRLVLALEEAAAAAAVLVKDDERKEKVVE
jgi:selenocysteine lyase/cysteine desulfurase